MVHINPIAWIKTRMLSRAEVGTAALTVPTRAYTSWGGEAYAEDTFRAAVDAIARHAAKLEARHIIDGATRRDGADKRLARVVGQRPNPYMSAYDMLYKLVTHLEIHSNAFALVDRDQRGSVAGIYPIDCTGAEFLEDAAGTLYARFRLKGGDEATFPYSDVIHLRRGFNSDPLLGDANDALAPVLEAAHAQSEGITNGIRSGASIRGILKFDQLIGPEQRQKERDLFISNYMGVANSGGVVVTDAKMSYQPIDSKPVTIDPEQMKQVAQKVYGYLGISGAIVDSTYDEVGFQAFYESIIEPLALQLSSEFTEKIFTKREQSFGNRIVFEGNRLQYATLANKADALQKLVPYGLITQNQALEILNLPPVEGGDKRLQTLNVVDQDKANQYQLNDKDGATE